MPVLSIKRSVDQLDRSANQILALQEALIRCIQSAAHYAVELRPSDASDFRKHLANIARDAREASTPASTERLHTGFRGELRAYQEIAHAELARIREEMANLIGSVQTLMSTVGGSTEDLHQTLHREFATLEATAESGDLPAIRGAIHHAVETATRTCDEALRTQELLAAQLKDEIRNLHKVVDFERNASRTDPATGVWNRSRLDARIKDLILLNEPFCVFFAGLPGLLRATRNDPRVTPELLKAVAGRLHTIAGKDHEVGMTGRWSEEVFAIVFNLPLAGAPTNPNTLQRTLDGTYAIQMDGANHNLSLDVRVEAAERPKNFPEAEFYLQLGQAAFRATSH